MHCARLASYASLATLCIALGWAQAPKPQVSDIPAPATAASRNPAPAARIVPAHTPIALQLETHLSTRDNSYGDGFAARVAQSVYYQGREVIPAGAILEGHVMRVRDERPLAGDSELLLKPDLLTMPDGSRYTISAEVVQSDPLHAAKVDSEGVLHEPRGMMKSDLHHTEIGSAGGFIGGAVLAGGQGALLGAGVGAAVAVGIWLVRHRHLDLNPGSRLVVRLDQPLQLHASGN